MIAVLGLAGWGVAARQPEILYTRRSAHFHEASPDPAEGPSRTGFAPVVKSVLPDVVNISTSKVVKASRQDQFQFETPDGMPPFFSSSSLDGSSAPAPRATCPGNGTSARTASAPVSS